MLPVLTPSEMAACDAAAIGAGTPADVLVARAGGAVARTARRLLGGTYGRRVTVVCGPGNNGADGDVAARRLSAWGARVDCLHLAVDGGLDHDRFRRALARSDLAIDAMFGTGLRRPLVGAAADVADALDRDRAQDRFRVLAVDIPSGVDGRSGEVDGPAVRATATVTMAALKPGLVLGAGADHAGDVEVADIGIEPSVPPPVPPDGGLRPGGAPRLGVVEEGDVAAWLPRRRTDTHKWAVGGVFVVAGSGGMTGAALLCSRAALRAGAGIVVCGLPGAHAAARASGGEVVTVALPATQDGALDEPAADTVLSLLCGPRRMGPFGALVVGPGLGRSGATVRAVRRLVAGATVPLVLDADGLNALEGDLGPLRARDPGSTVLTPHAGEFARLAGGPVGRDRVAAARRLAAAAGAVVLQKGSPTIVAGPDGAATIVTSGGPELATAGTGDVLAGIIAALVAQGLTAACAPVAGAFLHGRAGAVATGRGAHGPSDGRITGLVAGDLPDLLPTVFAELDRLHSPHRRSAWGAGVAPGRRECPCRPC